MDPLVYGFRMPILGNTKTSRDAKPLCNPMPRCGGYLLPDSFHRCFGSYLGNLWINDEHLVTTISDTGVLFTDDVLNDVGDRLENLITDLMSKSIIDGFELV